MAANSALRITELDFFSIKENLKDFLRTQDTFTDYDFEGSGLSILLDVLAYNTYYQSFYLNMAANEAFLDTAQIRQNVLSHAKLLGYVPNSQHGARSVIDITATPSGTEDNSTTEITLNKYTRLLGYDIDGINHPFVTVYSNTATKASGSFYFANVHIRQGEVVTLQYPVTVDNTKRRYQIPSANVDVSTIQVLVQQSTSNTDITEYTLYTDLMETTSNSAVYFVEEDQDLRYTIYFGDGVVGKKPTVGNIVQITYLDTVGREANDIKNFAFIDPVGGLFSDNVQISNVTSSYAGSAKESIEQVRFRAPYYYTTQNRAITVDDYKTLLMKDYNNIESLAVWGGEDNDPPVYGKVYISMKTKDYYSLSLAEKESIKNDLIRTRNAVTVIPEIVDPDYTYIQLRGKVYYNPTLTTKTPAQLLTLVNAAVADYNEEQLNTFESTFRKYKLQEYIENADPSIVASDIDVYMQKQTEISFAVTKSYEFNFNSKIKRGTFYDKLSSFPQVVVIDSAGVERQIFFEEVPDSFTGVDSISITNAGINYTSTPTVTITGDGSSATATARVVNGRIQSITVTNKGVNYSRAEVTITGGGGSEATAEAVLEARYGILRSYYYKTNGEKVIINDTAGTINYDTGKVTIDSLTAIELVENDFYTSEILTISVVPEDEVILPLRNRILSIDLNNPQSIQLGMVIKT